MIQEISDLNFPGADLFACLSNNKLRTAFEEKNGIFIAESPNVISRAISAGYEPVSFFTTKKHLAGDAKFLVEKYPDLPFFTGDDYLLEQIAGFKLTRGVMGAFRRKSLPSVESVCKNARRIAVLEDICDATNLGAIFRSAAALDLDALLITPSCCDPLCRRSARVSMGNVFLIPWTRIGRILGDWPKSGIEELKSLGFKTVALALRDDSYSLEDKGLKNQEKLALILGTEGTGLSDQTISLSDFTVKIPMRPGVDSLNVAAAAAVAFWELRPAPLR